MRRKLPTGELAKTDEEYFEAWDSIKIPLERELGLQTIGYDPGILMRDPDSNSTIDLSVGLAQKIVARLSK